MYSTRNIVNIKKKKSDGETVIFNRERVCCLTLDCFIIVVVLSEKTVHPHQKVLILKRYDSDLWDFFEAQPAGNFWRCGGSYPSVWS